MKYVINSLRALPLLGYAVFIGYASTLPSAEMPNLNVWDKLQHFGAYLLFVLLAYPLTLQPRNLHLIVIAICAYGGALELAQAFSPGRYASFLDFIANSFGALSGLLLLKIFLSSNKPRPIQDSLGR
ncbi:MAG: VanZ family protein [Gammaproteobacteria bacterium]|nr:VanZ family protein [Gammaproteobacteria bacterium]MBU1832817.1 VanZ family protein [Gammaproteobacteria bacterium]